MCNRARMLGEPETIRERFGATWPSDRPMDNHSSVGLTTTMLVIATDEPFGRSIQTSTTYRHAVNAGDARDLGIVSAGALVLDRKA